MANKGAIRTRRWNGRTVLLLWGPPVVLSLFIFAVSFTPGSKFPEHPQIFNFFYHFLEFAFLAFFLARALAPGKSQYGWGFLVLTVSMCALLGFMDELFQFTVPQRTFDVRDLFIDIIGAFTGTSLYIRIRATLPLSRPHAGNLSEDDDV